MPNTGIFTIYLEDHTIGNIIKMQLLREENVIYAGYRAPHPLENKIEIKVKIIRKIQTDGKISPHYALREAYKNLIADLDSLYKKFGVKN